MHWVHRCVIIRECHLNVVLEEIFTFGTAACPSAVFTTNLVGVNWREKENEKQKSLLNLSTVDKSVTCMHTQK